MRRRQLLGWVPAGVAAVLVASCSADPPPPREIVTLDATNQQPDSGFPYTDPVTVGLYQQRDDLLGLYDTRWEFWAEESPGVLIVGVLGGIYEATGVVVTVDETPSQIGVGIAVGGPPGLGPTIAVGVLGAVRVVLSAPVADRAVVDLSL